MLRVTPPAASLLSWILLSQHVVLFSNKYIGIFNHFPYVLCILYHGVRRASTQACFLFTEIMCFMQNLTCFLHRKLCIFNMEAIPAVGGHQYTKKVDSEVTDAHYYA